jgi:hypothetical protein
LISKGDFVRVCRDPISIRFTRSAGNVRKMKITVALPQPYAREGGVRLDVCISLFLISI